MNKGKKKTPETVIKMLHEAKHADRSPDLFLAERDLDRDVEESELHSELQDEGLGERWALFLDRPPVLSWGLGVREAACRR